MKMDIEPGWLLLLLAAMVLDTAVARQVSRDAVRYRPGRGAKVASNVKTDAGIRRRRQRRK